MSNSENTADTNNWTIQHWMIIGQIVFATISGVVQLVVAYAQLNDFKNEVKRETAITVEKMVTQHIKMYERDNAEVRKGERQDFRKRMEVEFKEYTKEYVSTAVLEKTEPKPQLSSKKSQAPSIADEKTMTTNTKSASAGSVGFLCFILTFGAIFMTLKQQQKA